MAFYVHNWSYDEPGRITDEEAHKEKQDELSEIVKKELKDHTPMAKVAVKLLEQFLLPQSYYLRDRNISGMEAIQCPAEFLTEKYWEDVFSKETSSTAYWNTIFAKDSSVTFDVGEKIRRMVFHFVHKWPKFRDSLMDKAIPEDKKLTVLMKQLENIVFFSRNRIFGNCWRMYSTPDVLLPLAWSDGHGTEITAVVDQDANIGLEVCTSTVGDIPDIMTDIMTDIRAKGMGAHLDAIDKKLYECIIAYGCRVNNISTINDKWTMVRASFKKIDGEEIRCYAFSGEKGSANPQHNTPLEYWEDHELDFKKDIAFTYWEYHKFDHLYDDMDIFVCNIDQQLVCQNMILTIFNALKPFVLEDLTKLTEYIAFDDSWGLAQALCVKNRSDFLTLDYREYFDRVVEFSKDREKILKKTIAPVLTNRLGLNTADVEELLQKIWNMVTVNAKNRCFVPKEEDLEKILGKETAKIIIKISKQQLAIIKEDLDKMPELFLSEKQKELSKCHCGEDNVLSLLLSKFLKHVDDFRQSPVDFVALDGEILKKEAEEKEKAEEYRPAKPFCEVCGRKVRFYPLLPAFFSELGFKGEDIGGNGDISKQLAVLFAKIAERT